MKKIALDLDGVIFDSENLYRVYTEIYDVEVHGRDTLIDNSQRLFQKRYSWNEEEFKNFYRDYSRQILKSASIMTGAGIALTRLKDNFELIIVTSRNDEETEIAKNKLKMIGLGDIQIFNNEQSKIDRLMREHVDYVIDDDSSVCINASISGIKALYFRNNAANKINYDNVINVNNWGEIYKYLTLTNM